MSDYTFDPKYMAAIKMLGRTGMQSYRIAHSDEVDEGEPVIWHATGMYAGGAFEVAAGRDPVQATLRLCDILIDGGECLHCHRMTIFDHENTADQLQMSGDVYCVYAWDPELKTFRRDCEGET